MLELLRQKMADYQPVDHWVNAKYKYEAAVLIPFTDINHDPYLILTKRSENLSSHRGEVALPGGRKDDEDTDLTETALRESWEEIGLLAKDVEVLGHLDPMITRFGVKVTPVVGIVPSEVDKTLKANPDEIDSIFHVPLSFFQQDKRLRTDRGTVNGHKIAIPCWEYEGYQIWGVTAIIITDMLNQVYAANIETGIENLSPESRDALFDPAMWLPIED